MMHSPEHRLLCHPDTPPRRVSAVAVRLAPHPAHGVALQYRIAGAAELDLPPPATPARTDNLWRMTCGELFVHEAESTAYREFNFSPSGAWAAYHFAGYRAGMAPLPLARDPVITLERGGAHALLEVHLSPDALAGGDRIGLCAVIVEAGGHTSFWALAHAPGKPDFHNPACFAVPLAARGGA